MATVNVEYINPLLGAAVKVIKEACQLDVSIGKPVIADTAFTNEEFLILMGITGEMKGQAILDFGSSGALRIASAMCMMQMDELNELAQSAVCELCNMILGNAATLFSVKGISIDITPPTICTGNVAFTNTYAANIRIPILLEGSKLLDINIAIKED